MEQSELAQVPSDYLGPMVDTEGRGAQMSRELIGGRLADVLREKTVRVVGTGFNNSDGEKGPERQNILRAMAPGEVVNLVREPENAHDPNAIAVYYHRAEAASGRIGYIGANIARGLAADMDGGWTPYGLVSEVKASGRSGELYATFFVFNYVEGESLAN